ncbi:MAG TPA: FAD-binding oxidoreductase [Devosia sp.]|nr:FAD-binding oxidoreductase [Devosia sp.]
MTEMKTAPLPAGAHIAIVGAGIIGTSAAFSLRQRGYAVTLFDRAEAGRTGPSFGNAGHLAADGIFPLASPGIGLRGLKMLLTGKGPLKVPKSYLPTLTPWLWRFWRTSFGEAQEQAIAALTQMATGTLAETEALWGRAGMANLLTRKPLLQLYDTEASYQMDLPNWHRLASAGFGSTPLDAAAIRDLEPALAPIFPRGMLSHEYGRVTDPFEVVTAMFNAAVAAGVVYERAMVDAIRHDGEDRAGVVVGGKERTFDAVLVTAGSWAKDLATSIEDNLPVEAERGYNFTYPDYVGKLDHAIILADRGLAVTPLSIGLRFGGFTELGGVKLPPNPRYFKAIRAQAEEVMPGLGTAEAREWMGHRPSMPDAVPVISRSTIAPRVFYAVGHGHYGLSNSAKTAKFVTELIADGADETYRAFSIRRFN